MAKLAFLALAFAAIVAFSEVSAYTTTIKDNDFSNTRGSQSYQQCRRQIPMQEVNHCEMRLTLSQQEPHLHLCCNQLKNIEQECQCEAIQQVFQQAQQEQQKQGGRQGSQQQMEQILRKAEQLPKDCNLQVQQCPIRSSRV